MQKLQKSNRGFTIIEVLIVLAIAALIMLIVFLAVPALQRNSRNNARNNDASRIASAITECLANRNGDKTLCDNNPTTELQFGTLSQLTFTGTIADTGADLGTGSSAAPVIGFQQRCNDAGSDDIDGTSRSFAIMFQNETNIDRCIGG